MPMFYTYLRAINAIFGELVILVQYYVSANDFKSLSEKTDATPEHYLLL